MGMMLLYELYTSNVRCIESIVPLIDIGALSGCLTVHDVDIMGGVLLSAPLRACWIDR
jgi:hypothetical protein